MLSHSLSALPDPATAPEFYRNVPLKRALAWVIDTALIIALSLLVLPFTAFLGVFFFPFLMLVLGFTYRCVTIARHSATWGMRLMAIELRDISGAPLSAGLALAHTTGYTVSIIAAPLQLLSILAILLTPRGQSLTDMVLGTTAINRPG